MLLLYIVVLMPIVPVPLHATSIQLVQPALVIITQVCVNNSLPVMDSHAVCENDEGGGG